jgi:thiol-disulfide isomerase/thioredoxin
VPCRAEAPHLEALSRKYRDQGLVVLGFNDERQPAAAIDFARKTLTYRLLTGAGQVFQQYRVRVIPCTVIIDRDGKILTRHTGFAPGQERVMEDVLR